MSKHNDGKRGNKEAKKPKQEKPKIPATSNGGADKASVKIAGKKM